MRWDRTSACVSIVLIGIYAAALVAEGTSAPPSRARTGGPDAPSSGLRLVPEWAPVRGVVAGISEALDPAALRRVSGVGAERLVAERTALYAAILRESPEVDMVLFVDAPHQVDAARRAVGPSERLTVLAQPAWVWFRDFAPISARTATGETALVAYTRFMRNVSSSIAAAFDVPLIGPPVPTAAGPALEGGNLLVDGRGACYTAVDPAHPNGVLPAAAAALGRLCETVRTVPRLPLEPTGHIDVFARLLDAETALVARYTDDSFHIADEPVEQLRRCTPAQVRARDWAGCAPTRTAYPDMGGLERDAGASRPLAASRAELPALLGDLYPRAVLEIDSAGLAARPDRRAHLDAVSAAFRAWGFRVLRVDNPRPYVALELTRYLDAGGSEVHRVLRGHPAFPTYVNSLLVNGAIYLPQYATATDELNRRAVRLHRDAGFRVEPVDLTQSIALRGAARCLTATIHGRFGLAEHAGGNGR